MVPDETQQVADDIDRTVKSTVKGVFGWGVILTQLILATASTAELFIRKRVGIRSLLFSGLLVTLAAFIFNAVWLNMLDRPYNEAFGCFLIAFAFAWASHILDWLLAKDRRHSWQPGVPAIWSGAPYQILGPRGVVYIGEPLLCIAAGSVVTHSAPMLGVWLIIAGVALFLKALIAGSALAEAVRQHVDQEIEAQILNAEIHATRVTIVEEIHVVRPGNSSDQG